MDRSLLQRVQKVYRGLAGNLPESMRTEDQYGARGGVELGFMSTTADRSVALEYASSSPGSLVLELEQGLLDRGAEISWRTYRGAPSERLAAYCHLPAVCCLPSLAYLHLPAFTCLLPAARPPADSLCLVCCSELLRRPCASMPLSALAVSQYPGEAEVCFPPLTALDVHSSKVQASILVVGTRPSLCTRPGSPPKLADLDAQGGAKMEAAIRRIGETVADAVDSLIGSTAAVLHTPVRHNALDSAELEAAVRALPPVRDKWRRVDLVVDQPDEMVRAFTRLCPREAHFNAHVDALS